MSCAAGQNRPRRQNQHQQRQRFHVVSISTGLFMLGSLWTGCLDNRPGRTIENPLSAAGTNIGRPVWPSACGFVAAVFLFHSFHVCGWLSRLVGWRRLLDRCDDSDSPCSSPSLLTTTWASPTIGVTRSSTKAGSLARAAAVPYCRMTLLVNWPAVNDSVAYLDLFVWLICCWRGPETRVKQTNQTRTCSQQLIGAHGRRIRWLWMLRPRLLLLILSSLGKARAERSREGSSSNTQHG